MVRPAKQAAEEETVTLGLRVPGKMKNELERVASRESRTMSAEAERRLRRSFDPDAQFVDALETLQRENMANPLAAQGYVRTVLLRICGNVGDNYGKAACLHAIAKLTEGTTTKVKGNRADLDALKASVAELERLVDFTTKKA